MIAVLIKADDTCEILYYLLTLFKVLDDDSARFTDQIMCYQQSLCYYVSQVSMDIVFVTNHS